MPRSESIPRRSVGAFTMVELLGAIVVVLALILALVLSLRSVSSASRSAKCIQNMKQLAVCILQYSVDNNGNLLPAIDKNASDDGKSGATWFQVLDRENLLPYDRWHQLRTSVMRCPERTSLNPRQQYGNAFPSKDFDGSHYAMLSRIGVSNLIEKGQPLNKLSAIGHPSRTVMLGEADYWYYISVTSANYRIYPHRGGCNLLYFDGHAVFHPGKMPVYSAAQQTNSFLPPFY